MELRVNDGDGFKLTAAVDPLATTMPPLVAKTALLLPDILMGVVLLILIKLLVALEVPELPLLQLLPRLEPDADMDFSEFCLFW